MKPLFASATIAAASVVGAAQADTIMTTSLNTYTLDLNGTTYTGALAISSDTEFDISDNFYATFSLAYVTASGASAFGYGASAGYLITNDLNTNRGTGARVGAGINLTGAAELNASFAVSPEFVANASFATPIENFGSDNSYEIGVEYTPLGIYGSYSAGEIESENASIEGFGIGYRTRF